MKYQIALVVFGLACLALASPIARVEEQIWNNLEESELTNVLITFRRADNKAAWDRFYGLRLTTREAILETQHAILKDHADVIQADVTAALEKAQLAGKRHYLDQLWITSELIVRDVDRETIEMLMSHPDVESLVAEQFIPLEQTEEGESFDLSDFNNTIQNQWGVVNVQAPGAWARGITGTGIVIGNIDTGARHTHTLLSGTYRGNNAGENHNYNWRAPTGGAAAPSDTNGHGTHCIGTHSGTGGIGVAPNSRWIACRGCATASCSTFDLNSCGNFMACPTNTAGGAAQCARAPRVVNNSWGGAGGQTWYNAVLTAWRNAGISGVFAQGNSGTACNTAGSPGDQPLINVKVTFRRADTKSAWDRFYALRLTTREAILETQHAILKDHADVIQADVTAALEKAQLAGKRHYLDQLWITSELIVRDVDRETIEMLMSHPDVESLVAEQFIQLEQTEEGESFDLRDFNNTIQNQWGVVNVQAPAAWARGITGTGIVIGNIDTGARATHTLLSGTYRGNNPGENHNYNWRAPTGGAAAPSDTNGHGTHCIGTHSGTGGIGVAPNSRWIACRGCATAACSRFDLESCGNFMACPTNTAGGAAQCARAPRVVNNSWGGGGGQTWYNPVLTAWRNAGISGVFAQGNSGTACSTAGSPADQPLAFGVGSITSTNTLSTFSSVGPGPGNSIKPDVAAPGTSVASASHLTDTGLRTLSETSMASPHVAGAVALVFHARGGTVVAAHARLTSTALAHTSGGRTCVGRPEGSRPNNHVEHGRINANAAA